MSDHGQLARSRPTGSPDAPIRVLIFDEQSVIRAGLRAMLEDSDRFAVVADTGDSRTAVRLSAELAPDVVVMEVRLSAGDGMGVLAEITRQAGCPPRVLVVTNVAAAECVYDCLRNGASGFILKQSSAERILDALDTVHQGHLPLDPTMTRSVVGIYPHLTPRSGRPPRLASLSEREAQIVALLARGLGTPEVALRLRLSVATVKSHISHVLTKWDVRDRVQLVARAYETGFAQQFVLEDDPGMLSSVDRMNDGPPIGE